MKPRGGLLGAVVSRVKRLASAFSDRPVNKVDDMVLEHLLMYHGLVGSTPENQPAFKDVRADVLSAISQQSSRQLSIALKLAPLWWQEKLESIISEAAAQYGDSVTATLLPGAPEEQRNPESDPLSHQDWRVRANCAILLAAINEHNAVPRLVLSLEESSADLKPAFSHIALSLSRLQNDDSFAALEGYLRHEEPWFRVDAANSLSRWPRQKAAFAVMQSLLQHHELSDYCAAVVARNWPIEELLASDDPMIQQGAAEVVIGVLQAAAGTFNGDLIAETRLFNCWPVLQNICRENPSPTNVHAALLMSQWLEANPDACDQVPAGESLELFRRQIATAVEEKVLAAVKQTGTASGAQQSGELRNAVLLCGRLKLKQCGETLIAGLKPGSEFLDDLVEAAGLIGDAAIAPHLVQLANDLVDLDDRTAREKTNQAVYEDAPDKARTYWLILKALGNLPAKESLEFLLSASEDFAADKREQAMSSLLSVFLLLSRPPEYRARLHDVVGQALNDPSTRVRLIAAKATADCGFGDYIPQLIKMSAAKEASLSRQCVKSLENLYGTDQQSQVVQQLQAQIGKEFDRYRREWLNNFLASLRQTNHS